MFSAGKKASPAQTKRSVADEEDPAAMPSPDLSRKRRAVNKDGLQLTESGRIAGSTNNINVKYDSAYSNPENQNRLLGRSLTL